MAEYKHIFNPFHDTVHIVVGSLSDLCKTGILTAPYQRIREMKYHTCNNWPCCINESKKDPLHHFLHVAKILSKSAVDVKIAAIIEDCNTKSKNSNDIYKCHEGSLKKSLHKFQYQLAFSMILMVRPKITYFDTTNEPDCIFGGPGLFAPRYIIPDGIYKSNVKDASTNSNNGNTSKHRTQFRILLGYFTTQNYDNHRRPLITVGSTSEPIVVIVPFNERNSNEGDLHLWHILLNHVTSHTSCIGLLTLNGVTCLSFKNALQLTRLFRSNNWISQKEVLATNTTVKDLFAYLYASRKKGIIKGEEVKVI